MSVADGLAIQATINKGKVWSGTRADGSQCFLMFKKNREETSFVESKTSHAHRAARTRVRAGYPAQDKLMILSHVQDGKRSQILQAICVYAENGWNVKIQVVLCRRALSGGLRH